MSRNRISYTQHCLRQPVSNMSIVQLPTGGASSIPSRKELNCITSIAGSTQDDQRRTLPLLSSLLHKIFFSLPSVEYLGIDSPGKGGVKEMPVQKWKHHFTALITWNPRRNKTYSHISSIISEKERNQRTSDKVGNETANKQTRTSTNWEEKKENKTHSPQIANNVYCTSHSQLHFISYQPSG